MKGLDGKVALVTGGGEPVGRAIALALSARGVRVIVTGAVERALGETVGEIAHGGGKARHLAGEPTDPAHLAAAVARAVEVFGGLDFAIANEAAVPTFAAAKGAIRAGGRLVTTTGSADAVAASVVEVAIADAEPEAVAELVVLLCASTSQALTGHTITIAARGR